MRVTLGASALLLLAFIALVSPASAQTPQFAIAAFPSPTSSSCDAVDINDRGDVLVNCVGTGTSVFAGAYLWTNGSIVQVVTRSTTTGCVALNNPGHVLCNSSQGPYLSRNGVEESVTGMLSGADLNDRVDVAGQITSSTRGLKPRGGPVSAAPPDLFLFAFANFRVLNNRSQVAARPLTSPLFDKVGAWSPASGFVPVADGWDLVTSLNDFGEMTSQLNARAMLYTPDRGWRELPHPPGIPASRSSWAQTVNSAGQVSGYTIDSTGQLQRAAFWPNPSVGIDLGAFFGLRTFVVNSNASGRVIGSAIDTANNNRHIALLWTLTWPGSALPTVSISVSPPGNGVRYIDRETALFVASAWSASEGDVSSRVRWTSSQNNVTGTGSRIHAQLRIITSDTEIVTATVTDSNGLTASVSINVAMSAPPSPPTITTRNVALPSFGTIVRASSTYSADFDVSSLTDGDRTGKRFWNDATLGQSPDTVELIFPGNVVLGLINVFTVQDNYADPSEPTTTQLFSLYGVTDFEVQYRPTPVSDWTSLPGSVGKVAGNRLVWRPIGLGSLITSGIRIVINGSVDGYSRLAEVEAWTQDLFASGLPLPSPPVGTNVASAFVGAKVQASSSYSSDFAPSFVNDGDRAGKSFWNDATFGSTPDSVEIEFARPFTIDRVNVFSVQDTYSDPSPPTEGQTFSSYGLTDFEIQQWTGSAWVAIPGASVSANSLVWRSIVFIPVTTQKIRLVITGNVDGYSRVTEIEALTAHVRGFFEQPPPGTNVAFAFAGAAVNVSSFYSTDYSPAFVNDGNRAGPGFWNSAVTTTDGQSNAVEISFRSTYYIGEVNLFSVQDDHLNPSTPTPTQTFTRYGVTDFTLQYWNNGWVNIPDASVVDNTLVWRNVTFTPVLTQKLRVVITGTADGYARLTEIEAIAKNLTN